MDFESHDVITSLNITPSELEKLIKQRLQKIDISKLSESGTSLRYDQNGEYFKSNKKQIIDGMKELLEEAVELKYSIYAGIIAGVLKKACGEEEKPIQKYVFGLIGKGFYPYDFIIKLSERTKEILSKTGIDIIKNAEVSFEVSDESLLQGGGYMLLSKAIQDYQTKLMGC